MYEHRKRKHRYYDKGFVSIIGFSTEQHEGNVIPGFIIAILGVILNFYFFWSYKRSLEKQFDPIIHSQYMMYRAKTGVDTCVVFALGCILCVPDWSLLPWVDLGCTLIVACGLGIFALSFGDGFAALIGKRYGKYTPKLYANKSVAGTLACVLFAFLGMALVSLMMGHVVAAWKLLVLGVLAAVLEIFSGDWDNIAIPIPVMIVGYLVNV